MMHRGPVRVAVAAGAAMVAGLMATTPAAAAPTTPGAAEPAMPLVNLASLNLPSNPLLAKDVATKGCGGIPDGAKPATDGWVFDQPVQGVDNHAYVFEVVDSADEKPALLWIDNQGIVAIDLNNLAPVGSLNAKKAGAGDVKALIQAARNAKAARAAATDETAPSRLPFDLPVVALPAGVAGGLIENGGAWLQTPAGWQLVDGALIHDNLDADPGQTFDVVRVCEPEGVVAAPTPTPTASASASAASTPSVSPSAGGVGGGTGRSLPVTGAGAGIIAGAGVLLIGVGAMLFVVRRRRGTTFVA